MQNPTSTDGITTPAHDTHAVPPSVARRANRRAIDCGGASDVADAMARARYEERVDARRAFDECGGVYADQVQAI